jgi:uncharacterized protein YaeQ
MALKSTIYKARLQIADMDRSLYADHALTLARHPSETDERLMLRVLAFALAVPADDHRGTLDFTAGLSDTEAPDLWQRDLTGAVVHWIDIGQPDERRIARACGRAEQVTVWLYSGAMVSAWASIETKLARMTNLTVWQIAPDASRAMAALAQRQMQLQITVQEGQVWVGNGAESVALEPVALKSKTSR